jgi:drug/metabolite transporter (DMT)-like permease
VAQTRRRRRRKHRGTQAGTVGGRAAGRPRTRQEARDRARSRMRSDGRTARRSRVDRRDQPPTWRGAINRALIGAGIFLLLLLLPFHQPVSAAIPLAALMMVVYVPLGYSIERFFYNRRQAQKARAAQSDKR